MMSVVLVLGMYPVYSIFPYSYRRLLRRVHPHLTKVVVDTEREKAVNTIIRVFRRKRLYNLLSISIPKSNRWIERLPIPHTYSVYYTWHNTDFLNVVPCRAVFLCDEGFLPSCRIAQYKNSKYITRETDLIDYIIIPISKERKIRVLLGNDDLFYSELDDEVEMVRINMRGFPMCSLVLQEIQIECNDKMLVVSKNLPYRDNIRLNTARSQTNVNQITVDAFYTNNPTPKRIGEFPELEFKRCYLMRKLNLF